MSSYVPTPVAAALGLLPTILGGVRALPTKAVQLPIFALSSALNGLDTARRGYDDLAERGERLLGRLRGMSFDEIEDNVEDRLQGTTFAAPYDRLEDAAETVTAFVRSPVAKTRRPAAAAAKDPAVSPDQAPKGAPTPTMTQPDRTRVTSAASPDVVATVEHVAATIGAEVLAHDDLPLPDYDHLTLGALRGRMRSLDLPALLQLRDYERATARRLPVVTMLDNRIAKLASDPTAPLSAGGTAKAPVSSASEGAGGSKISPATAAPAATAPTVAHGGLGGDPR